MCLGEREKREVRDVGGRVPFKCYLMIMSRKEIMAVFVPHGVRRDEKNSR